MVLKCTWGFREDVLGGPSPHPVILAIKEKWVFTKIRGTTLRIPRKRTIVFGGLYWGPPI